MASNVPLDLETDGIAVVENLLTAAQLRAMQVSFSARLRRMRWNDFDGYEKTERYRFMVQDVLALDQGFVDLALHPLIVSALREYIGPTFELVEAKGWKSLPTNRDFHGWHGDAWYDQTKVRDYIPREVKLGVFLTNVTSGGFVYAKGSHRKHHPKNLGRSAMGVLSPDQTVNVTGPAGLAFLFDTSGIHRQSIPILEPREAVFLAYHDPSVPLQSEDIAYYRYHPLNLNAAFLGNLTQENCRILGFGNKTNYQPSFERKPANATFQSACTSSYEMMMRGAELSQRIRGKIRSLKATARLRAISPTAQSAELTSKKALK